jgi:hypothetical protein
MLCDTINRNGFDPEAIEALHSAYSQVCNALHVFAGDRRGREAVALRVLDLAQRTGVVDPKTLTHRVLTEVRQQPR